METREHYAAEIQAPRRRGRPNLNNLRVGIGSRLTPEEAEALDSLAKKMGTTRAAALRFLIRKQLAREGFNVPHPQD